MKFRFSALSGFLLCGLALAWSSAAVAITVTPASVTIKEGVSQQFTASVASTWKVSCGSISSAGLYKAGVYAGSCTVTATAKSGGQQATAKVTVTSPITMTPQSAKTPQGHTQQFTASVPVTWATKCGSINASGLYTASGTVGQFCSIWATASSGPPYTVYGGDTILAASGQLTVAPATASIYEGATQQFTASVSATWTTSCGTISSSGLYKAAVYEGSCTVTATAGSQKATATVAVATPIVMTPRTVLTPQGQTQQFTASVPVKWYTRCGSITASGLYTASGTVGQTCSTWAVASSGPGYTVYGWVQITAPGAFSLYPASITVPEGSTQQFIASAPASWSASCGTIALSSGDFTAPLTPGSCSVVATALDGSGNTATAAVTVAPSSLTLTPAALHTHALGAQHFTASTPVTWSSTCGTIDSNGNFTAPATAAAGCTVTATASSGTAYTAQAPVLVTVVNYTTWKNDNARDGLQADEQILTPANVNSTSFGPAWNETLDGSFWDQPLYMNALVVNGTPHNVLFVGTSNDSIYALDADTGTQLWKTSLLVSGATAVTGSTVNSTIAQLGILGTPVIDPDSHTLYAVAETAEGSGTQFVHRLHALDITTGAEQPGSPVLISDPALAPVHKLQRPGLLLANSQVYVAFGSIGDRAPYHGLLFAFDAGTLTQDALFNTTPTGSEGAIWASGGAPNADSDGNIYVATGNGTFDATSNFGQAVIELSPALQVMDYFAPFDYLQASNADLDLGSGGILLTPAQSGPYTHEAIICGKSTPIFVLNRDSLGYVGTTSDNIIQRLDNAVGGTHTAGGKGEPCFSTPSMWQENVYFVGNGDVAKRFTLDPTTGQLSTTPAAQGTFAYGYPGAQSVISSGDTQQAILWTTDYNSGSLLANDALTLKQLYQSPYQDVSVKWAVPTVVNGHVYVGFNTKIVAFSTH